MSYIGNQPTNVAFVTDQFSGTGSQTTFTMSVAPASTSSIIVAVTGVLQDPSTYSVSGTTLTFSAAPPSGTGNISVRYLGIPASGVTTTAYRTITDFTATAGQTTFTPPSYTVGYIDVYRNGSKLGLADFTATNGTTVVLANACNAGDLVETQSFYVSSVLNAIPATAGAVNSTYIANGAVGSAALASGAVTQTAVATGVASTGPAFSAYSSVGQVVGNATYTKIQYNTEEFDTNSNFDSTTNYRFTPTVAGYYQLTAMVNTAGSSGANESLIVIYKNGSAFKRGQDTLSANYGKGAMALVYANGSTDYFEIYFYQGTGGNLTVSTEASTTYFQGVLVRAA